MIRELHFPGTDRLVSGIEKMAKAVGSTMGVHGNVVLIESPAHTHGLTATKDGVTVAKAISLEDPVEELGVRVLRQAAEKTAQEAGDGTTTAVVLSHALVSEGVRLLGEATGAVNRSLFLRELDGLCESVVEQLRKMARPVGKRRLRDVAAISANNDAVLGKVIADVYGGVGADGVVTVEKSDTSKTYYEVTKGIKFDRGYTSHLFVNDQRREQCVHEDVYVLVSDAEISNILQIENVLRPVINERKKLLIIATCTQQVINTLAANVVKSGLQIVNVQPPSFGYKQHELMQDIALTVGAKYFSERTGDDLSLITFADLGHAEKVVIDHNSTVIRKDNIQGVSERISELKAAREHATGSEDRSFIDKRIASLSGGIGVIYVGGKTDLEQKELYDRVEDAVLAVRSALAEGILPGGGAPLHYLGRLMEIMGSTTVESGMAHKVMAAALKAPLSLMHSNAGLEVGDGAGLSWEHGIDLRSGEYGNLVEMGVIDPARVTISALKNAVSVAKTILSTNAIITLARDNGGRA